MGDFLFYGEVFGIKYGRGSAPHTFSLKTAPPDVKQIAVEYTIKCSLQEGDKGQFILYSTNDRFYMRELPILEHDYDENTIVRFIFRGSGARGKGAYNILRELKAIAEASKKTLFNAICDLSRDYSNNYNETIVTQISIASNVETACVRKFFLWWNKEQVLRHLLILGLTMEEIEESGYSSWSELLSKTINNPYAIASIHIDRCNDIVQKYHHRPGSEEEYRCGSILRHVWKSVNERGWCGVGDWLINKHYPYYAGYLPILKEKYGLEVDMKTLYMSPVLTKEKEVAAFLAALQRKTTGVERKIRYENTNMSDEQIQAVLGGLNNPITVITGGAGVGKSKTICELVANIEKQNSKYMICSYVGKAVAHLKSKLGPGRVIATMHRLISNAKKLKEGENGVIDYVIIDEASTVTIGLFYEFISKYPYIEHLILVGDVNQLAPIAWGRLFSQVISSETVPIYYLTKSYRVYELQEGCVDGITLNANRIINHNTGSPPFKFTVTNNFYVYEFGNGNGVELVMELVKFLCKNKVSPHDFVILSPYKKALDDLNKGVQSIYESGRKFIVDKRGTKWIVGDIVMLNENDNDIKVYNGECGVIKDVDDVKGLVWVDFGFALKDDIELKKENAIFDFSLDTAQYKPKVFDEENQSSSERTVLSLNHAHAMTVDKSQGSEWEHVIVYIPYINKGDFINRNRIYTAITRAKRMCYMVCPDAKSTEEQSVRHPPKRVDNLCGRLCAVLPHVESKKPVPPVEDTTYMDCPFFDDYDPILDMLE